MVPPRGVVELESGATCGGDRSEASTSCRTRYPGRWYSEPARLSEVRSVERNTFTPGLLSGARSQFRAVAEVVVPEAARLEEEGWLELETIVEAALAARPSRTRRQLLTFLRLVSSLSLLRFGRALASASTTQRTRLLQMLERSPIALLRRGTWGLRTLVLMGYYGRAEAAREIGYRAEPRGWEARL